MNGWRFRPFLPHVAISAGEAFDVISVPAGFHDVLEAGYRLAAHGADSRLAK